MKKRIKKGYYTFKRATLTMFYNYFEHGVGQHSAALAYYLLFALFPLLIFLSNLVGLLDFDIYAVTNALNEFLPDVVVEVIESYLGHVSEASTHALLWFSLIFTVWFPMRAAAGLMDDVRRAYGQGLPRKPIVYVIKQLVYTVVFLIVIVLTLFLTVLGRRVITSLAELFPNLSVEAYEYILFAWQYLRFLPMALLMVAAIATLYMISLDKAPKFKSILPGIFGSLISWLILSVAFSFYIENFSNYSMIYGTLGTIVIMMIWLYLTALSLILGAEFNSAMLQIKECL